MTNGGARLVREFLTLIRFSHTVFALPFALLAAVMAWRLRAIENPPAVIDLGPQDGFDLFSHGDSGHWIQVGGIVFRLGQFNARLSELLGILLCMITARGAAMAFNRLADRRLDAENPRTAGRHLPAGTLSVAQVVAFTAACGFAFFASTLLFLPNRLPLYLSVPVLALLCGYSYAKRFTSLAHFWLGAALASSPIAAWIAIRGEEVLANPADLLAPAVLGAAVLTWVAGFDILYATQDVDFDRRAKLHSIPVRLGVPGALRLAAACHFATIVFLSLLLWAYPPFGWIYAAGVAAVAALLLYEHALVRPDRANEANLKRINVAFFNVNAVISLGLLAVGTLDLLIG